MPSKIIEDRKRDDLGINTISLDPCLLVITGYDRISPAPTNENLASVSPPSTDSSKNEFSGCSDSFRYTASGVSRSAGSVSITGITLPSISLVACIKRKPPRFNFEGGVG